MSLPYTQNPDLGPHLRLFPPEGSPGPHLSPAGGLRGVELQSKQPGPNHVEPVHVDHIFCISPLKAKDPGGGRGSGRGEGGQRLPGPCPPCQHPLHPQRRPPHPGLLLVLQHLGVEAEVEAHALCPALFIAGGNSAELAVPGLPAPVPALNLGGGAQEASLGVPAIPLGRPTPSTPRLRRGHPHLLSCLWVDHCLLVKVECSFLILQENGHECGAGEGKVPLPRARPSALDPSGSER